MNQNDIRRKGATQLELRQQVQLDLLSRQVLGDFKQVTASISAWVKRRYPDMRDCETASQLLADALQSRGFTHALKIGCTVLIGRAADTSFDSLRCGTGSVCSRSSHYVVRVDGFVLDPTFGQFRVAGLAVPDYLLLRNADSMLNTNRCLIDRSGDEIEARGIHGTDLAVAYLPDGETYRPGSGSSGPLDQATAKVITAGCDQQAKLRLSRR